MTQESISLNKFISNTGISSRREADKWIDAGRVKINGVIAKKGNRVFEGDKVLLDDKPLINNPEPIYLAFNKPAGITSTTDSKDKDNIIDFINHPLRIFPVGRLDKASTGLIFLTNDGDIVNEILRTEYNHEKEYVVTVDRSIGNEFVKKMGNGIPVLGKITKKCVVRQVSNYGFEIILTEGLNRQIRRMCEYLDYKVKTLKRVRVMNVKLGKLKPGHWRELTSEELRILKSTLNKNKT